MLVLCGLCAAGLLYGQTAPMDFPPNGTLRIEHSTGDLTIEGWDQPGMEISTTKSGKDAGRVNIATKRNGNELVVTTSYPHHRAFPWITPLQTVENFDLTCVIRVPRNSKIVVQQGDGNVYINNVTGSIDAKVRQGLIALRLVRDMDPVIDAKSDWGSVNSDFAGNQSRHPFPLGHTFIESDSAAQNLHLRIGYGDIVILKAHQPKEPPPLPAAAGGARR
jgi:hypothetical protein